MSGPATPHPGALSTLTMAMLGGLVVVLVGGFLLITLTGRDVTTYVLFVAGPLVTTVTAALIGQRVKVVEDTVKVVEAQTNGLLSARLTGLHDHLDQQTEDLLGESAAPVVEQAGSPRSNPLPAQEPSEFSRENR